MKRPKEAKPHGVDISGWRLAPITTNFWNQCAWCEAKPIPLYFRTRDGEMEYACKKHALKNH